MMRRLKIITFNARGLGQSWLPFLKALKTWTTSHQIDIVCIQEHNLTPDPQLDHHADAIAQGFSLHIGYAPAGGRDIHWGGVMMLIRNGDWSVDRVITCESDLVCVNVSRQETSLTVATVYVPSQPQPRLDMLNAHRSRVDSL